jgi:hypothetical protein
MNADEQIEAARGLLQERLPQIIARTKLKPASAKKLAATVLADFDLYVAPALLSGTVPEPAQGTELAAHLGRKRTQLIDQMKHWVEPLESTSVMLGMDLADHSGEAPHTFCVIEQTDSPIGEDVHAPGMFKRERAILQRLLVPILTGPHLHNPLLVDPPASDELDNQGFTRQILATLAKLSECSGRLQPAGTRRIQTSSPAAIAPPPGAPSCLPLTTVLIPRLAAGGKREAGLRATLTAEVQQIRAMLQANEHAAKNETSVRLDYGFRRAVIEIPDEPYPDQRDLEWIDDAALRQYLAWMLGFVPLDLIYRPTGLELALEHRDEHETLIHRTVKQDTPELEAMGAKHESFALLGFGLKPGDAQQPRNPRMADPLLAVEVIAGRAPAQACAKAFGAQHAPANARGNSDEVRAFIRACRTIQRTALSFVAAGYTTLG